ncbi:MAG TPA: GNAT family N-acetyltransferase [Acidimicrobiales bacterium]|jgi:RimJ/RimL family protein N-acetyltransferase|nr:GNAT family N-acetyltransferase [Acidimicrobiales bacterium]
MTAFDLDVFTPPLQVPTLVATPVVLRPYGSSDLPLVRQAAADPLIPTISSIPRHYTDDAGRAFIQRQHARSAEGDGYSFVIASATESNAGLGSIGMWLRDIESGRASIGYWLVAGARGHGLAAHALRAVVSFAFGDLRIPRLHLFVEPWNVASARTAEAAGFGREAALRGWERIDGEQHDVECFAQLCTEWAGHDRGRS